MVLGGVRSENLASRSSPQAVSPDSRHFSNYVSLCVRQIEGTVDNESPSANARNWFLGTGANPRVL